ncbi:MAG TPA: DUF1285 domain-containing protein [Candidatus Binataceae bacterium]|nr:DUF1285 domain-containing protein [Candidatus Binataceae bacterium]
MARAGFYAVESGRISFRRDGHWYSDEERIDNPRIALLFSRSLKRNPDGSYYLQVAEERAPVVIEDTPWVVRSIEDDGRGGLALILNDESREPLDPGSLEVGRDNVLYCRVKGGEHRARMLRNAYNHLSPLFEPDGRGGFSIVVDGRAFPMRIADGA